MLTETRAGGAGSDDALAAGIDAIATAALAEGPLAGISLAVMQGDDLVVAKGYGQADVATQTPATADTLYDIASVTKLLTATAVMKLVQAGALDLDDDLASVLPEFPNAEQALRITVRHLLNHTSGLSDYEATHTEQWLRGGPNVSPAYVLDYLSGRPLDFEPGSRWSYSNSGFYLLGMIVERVSGRPFGNYVVDEVTEPLGLRKTLPCDAVFGWPMASRGYEATEAGLVPNRLFGAPNIVADGGFCSTVEDLARLPAALARGDVVSPQTLEQMRQPTTLTTGIVIDYGLGVRRGVLAGHPIWGHTGGMESYWAVLAHYPNDDVTIVVLINTENGAEDALTIEGNMARVVLELTAPPLRDVFVTMPQTSAFGGTYQAGSDRVRIYEQGDKLLRSREGSERPPSTLLYQGDGTFAWSEQYPMDRLVFHVVGDRAVGSSEYYNGIFAVYAHRVDL